MAALAYSLGLDGLAVLRVTEDWEHVLTRLALERAAEIADKRMAAAVNRAIAASFK